MGQIVAWFFVNVVVPIFSPLLLLLLLKIPPSYSRLSKGIVTRAVKDGQLFWIVIPMAAAAGYDAGVALGHPSVTKWIAWLALMYHILVIVISAVLVMLGTVASASESQGSEQATTTEKNLLLQVSILVTALTALTFLATHTGLAG